MTESAPSGGSGRAHGTRPRVWWFVVGGLLFWVAAVVYLVNQGIAAAGDASALLSETRRTADLGDLLDADEPSPLSEPLAAFSDSRTYLSNPIVRPATWLPVVGRQIRTAEAMATTAEDVLSGIEDLRTGLLDRTGDGLPRGAERVEFLNWFVDELDRLGELVDDADLGPAEALVRPLASARHDVRLELDDAAVTVADARAGAAAVRDLLATDARYLVLAANNAEMRTGTGMFLSIGTLRFEDGRVRVEDFEATAHLTLEGRVDGPADTEALWGFANPGQEWRNLGLTPYFDTNASMAAEMWSELGRGEVDGVLSIDVVGLATLVDVTGPVSVGGVEFDAEALQDHLLHDQYEDIDSLDDNAARRDALAGVAATVLGGLDAPDLDVVALADALRDAQAGRHLLAWSRDDVQQAGWRVLGVDGTLGPTSMLFGLANVDGSKLDPFVRLDARFDVATPRDGQTRVDVTVDVRNRTPAGEPRYIVGYDDSAQYEGVFVAYLPGVVTTVDTGERTTLAGGREADSVVLGLGVSVPRGESRQLRFSFSLPSADARALELIAGARTAPLNIRLGDRTVTDRRNRALDLYAT